MFSKALSSERQDIIITTLIFKENKCDYDFIQHTAPCVFTFTYHLPHCASTACEVFPASTKTVNCGDRAFVWLPTISNFTSYSV